jgi:hypothetical protein
MRRMEDEDMLCRPQINRARAERKRRTYQGKIINKLSTETPQFISIWWGDGLSLSQQLTS